MPDEKSKKRAARAKAQASVRPAIMRKAGAAHFAGASVHVSLAGEIGLRIVRGDYPPGTILPNEAKWAEIFNVSRSAVREAIKMLMAKSLLASRPKIGSWVEPKERWNLLDRDVLAWYATAPDREAFLRTVQEFRHIIEPEASAFAAMRRSDEQMAEISQACREMGEALSLQERIRADTRFHLAILRASGNDLLVPLGVLIESALDHLFAFTTQQVGDQRQAQKLHEAIEKNIRLQRPAAARNAVHKLLADTDEGIGRGRR
ncbi:GntR family transcriptional regulator [Mesorhizobium loti]|jgi:DNA-binding FadR family transcriptional regulator|uniref:GntR family transcriptional regulator n=1 Tax=Rhizobium loti TaxID=381 RepID=A0A8E2WJA5_RHILI|nr:FadR/GntR family transcriptional regulator [Mesorhizobium loti]PWJ95027.1 GntR family transcriptional regulator [Mesorhizobium loti]